MGWRRKWDSSRVDGSENDVRRWFSVNSTSIGVIGMTVAVEFMVFNRFLDVEELRE